MFHEDNTLNLLDTYRKAKFQEKTIGKFKTHDRKDIGVTKFVWIGAVVFVGYFIVTNFIKVNEKFNADRQTQKTILQKASYQAPQIMEKPQTIKTKNIEIVSNKPVTIAPQPQTQIIQEPTKQTTTITLIPSKTTQQQETVKKVEEEEIRPGSSTSNVGYYR